MPHAIIIDELEVSNTLGECALWDDQLQAFWWTDIEERTLFRYVFETRVLQTWETPFRVASFGLVLDDARLIVAFDRGVALYDIDTGSLDWLTPESFLPPGHRLNDGRVDRDGNFCVGSMIENKSLAKEPAKLFRIDHEHRVSVLLSGLRISNGLGWSPDGSRIFHADSPGGVITACDYAGLLAGKREPTVFTRTETGEYPDGATVDAKGQLWSAHWGGASVACYAPSGETITKIELPVSQPTCVALGGPDLDQMMVTSARQGLSIEQLASEPGAGNAFLCNTEVNGIPEPRFKSNR